MIWFIDLISNYLMYPNLYEYISDLFENMYTAALPHTAALPGSRTLPHCQAAAHCRTLPNTAALLPHSRTPPHALPHTTPRTAAHS
jgi:hypothetical protein